MKAIRIPVLCGTLLAYFEATSASLIPFPSIPIQLSPYFDNQAASIDTTGFWLHNGVTYDLPTAWSAGDDNVIANGQIVELPNATYVHELHLLYAGDGVDLQFNDTFNLNYADNSSQKRIGGGTLNWGDIRTPNHFDNYGASTNWNSSQIFQLSVSIPSRVPLKSITLPQSVNTPDRLYIFAISITPSAVPSTVPTGPELSIRSVQFSACWEDVIGQRVQAVAITLANLLPGSLASSPNTLIHFKYEVEVTGEGVTTVTPGMVYRLVVADQARFDVLVLNNKGSGIATITIKDSNGNVVATSSGWLITPLRQTWTADESVLSTHEPPTWWNQAKYGILNQLLTRTSVHWGIYSVPAYLVATQPTKFEKSHLEAPSGALWTTENWNASAWLDLIDEAGATYFVCVAKHHDGYGLFDTKNTTHRSSVYLNPYRDFLKELMETAKTEKPNLHRGTYYSFPE
ncbi:glycoside hydrolase [Imleria badia]|nr:glycoside hydrolase [Imleria badia]